MSTMHLGAFLSPDVRPKETRRPSTQVQRAEENDSSIAITQAEISVKTDVNVARFADAFISMQRDAFVVATSAFRRDFLSRAQVAR